uniref:Secreted protein n=1 Tax=Gongylonema pulchrum TaxID=637853 RepID=A0A183DM54_9BILA
LASKTQAACFYRYLFDCQMLMLLLLPQKARFRTKNSMMSLDLAAHRHHHLSGYETVMYLDL